MQSAIIHDRLALVELSLLCWSGQSRSDLVPNIDVVGLLLPTMRSPATGITHGVWGLPVGGVLGESEIAVAIWGQLSVRDKDGEVFWNEHVAVAFG
jgi:hypothetical protein